MGIPADAVSSAVIGDCGLSPASHNDARNSRLTLVAALIAIQITVDVAGCPGSAEHGQRTRMLNPGPNDPWHAAVGCAENGVALHPHRANSVQPGENDRVSANPENILLKHETTLVARLFDPSLHFQKTRNS